VPSVPDRDGPDASANELAQRFSYRRSLSGRYPDDETPAARGYHYTFFGNAFFIN